MSPAVPLLAAGLFLMVALPAAGQFVAQPSSPEHILEGNWQSCLEPSDGQYSERVYDHVVGGVGQFEVHLGPRNEFAIFPGVQEEHRSHGSQENLLRPFRVPLIGGVRAHRRWEIPGLNLVLTVTRGGGGSHDCESWYILLAPLDKPSH